MKLNNTGLSFRDASVPFASVLRSLSLVSV